MAARRSRDIEIDPAKSLYLLAEAIVSAFGFNFDHAFGFYAGLTPAKVHKEFPIRGYGRGRSAGPRRQEDPHIPSFP